MKKIIKAGSTDQTLDIFIQDSSSTTGAGLTGLAFNTASLVCYYRKGATGSATALTLATQTVGGAHSDGGFVEISSANMPGMYRLDLSDTIVATAGTVTLMLKGAADMAPLPIELQVAAMDVEGGVVPTLTTYTGNTPQTGDTYALANGANGFAALKTQTAAIETDTGTDLPATLATIAGYLDTEIADIQTRLPAALVGGRMDSNMQAGATGVISAALLAADAANEIADALLDRADAIETGETLRLAMRHALAALVGVLSGAATTSVAIKGAGVATTRISATVDADGNRSAVTLS